MARLTNIQGQTLGYWWSLVLDAVSNGLTSAETSAAAKIIATDQGRTLGFDVYQSLNVLYGYASRLQTAANELLSAPDEAPIVDKMIGTPPWARDQSEIDVYPIYHAVFSYDYIDSAGQQQSGFRTSVFNLTNLPDTVGGLTLAINDDAEAMAAKYGHQLLEIKPIALHVV